MYYRLTASQLDEGYSTKAAQVAGEVEVSA